MQNEIPAHIVDDGISVLRKLFFPRGCGEGRNIHKEISAYELLCVRPDIYHAVTHFRAIKPRLRAVGGVPFRILLIDEVIQHKPEIGLAAKSAGRQ